MKISSISGYNPYADYEMIMQRSAYMKDQVLGKENNISQVEADANADEVSKERLDAISENISKINEEELSSPALAPGQSKDSIDDIAKSIRNGIKEFEAIGRDARLEDLDKEPNLKALSQDSILQKYQYFVGNAGDYGTE